MLLFVLIVTFVWKYLKKNQKVVFECLDYKICLQVFELKYVVICFDCHICVGAFELKYVFVCLDCHIFVDVFEL